MYMLGVKVAAAWVCYASLLKERMEQALAGDDGMATLETVLLIAVLVALALMFKDVIVDFVSGILDGISSQGSSFNPSSIAN